MNAARSLLARLEGVRQTGPGRWVARCPAHEDRNPSLSIRETDDGRILVHDFAGCGAADVVAAVGLCLADLFPERLADHLPATRDRRHWHAAREALRAVDHDVLLVAIAAEAVAAGEVLSAEDRDLLTEAARHLREARRVAA
jgi:hypothetical protein